MSQIVSLVPTAQTRDALRRFVDDRRWPLAHVLRALVVPLSDERLPMLVVARRAGVGRPTVARWRRRFAGEGPDGLMRDRTRPLGQPATPREEARAELDRTLTGGVPCEATRWTGRAMAALCGPSLTTVQRIRRSHHLQPHRVRTSEHPTDPHSAVRLDDVGLDRAPPRHTIVPSVDEEGHVQALGRTQPRPPLEPGRCDSSTHDDERDGTATPFATLATSGGYLVRPLHAAPPTPTVRPPLDQIEEAVPAGKPTHAVAQQGATHRRPEVSAQLTGAPHRASRPTPTRRPRLNAVAA